MSVIWNLYNNVKSCLCPCTDAPQPAQPAKPEAAPSIYTFKDYLDWFANLEITELDCLDKCVEAARKALPPSVFDLSEASQQVIDAQFKDFETALQNASYLTASDRESLNVKFRRRVGEVIAEKWSEHMAKAFDPIASISDHNEKASAALRWADSYFQGLTFLRRCENEFNTGISTDFIARHAAMTVIALNAHCHAEVRRRCETRLREYKQDPAGFERRMEGLKVKVDGEAKGVRVYDRDIQVLANDMAQGVIGYWPEIDEKKAFLQKCIWTKFTLNSIRLSDAEKLFVAALKAKNS